MPKAKSQGHNRLLMTILIFFGLIGAGSAGLLLRYNKMPSGEAVKNFEPARVTQVKYPGSNDAIVNIREDDTCFMDNLPKEQETDLMKKIAIGSEDQQFDYHLGINPSSLLRALVANTKAMSFVEGGSTIDTQTAQEILKALYPNYTSLSTLDQKGLEMMFALKLNNSYMSKDRILYTYLQLVPTYRNLCGVSSVARQMLGKEPKDLNLNEITTIISSFPGPNIYDPINQPKTALKQRNITARKIIEGGLKNNVLTQAEADIIEKDVIAMPLPKFKAPNYNSAGSGSWVADTIKKELLPTSTLPSQYYGKGYQITTTFDPRIQRALEGQMKKWNNQGRFGEDWEVSAIIVDSLNFGVKGILGSRYDFSPTNQYNLSIDSTFQSGSVGKIAVYTAALQARIDRGEGESLNSIYITRPDWPLAGPTGISMSVSEALSQSINTAAVAALRSMETKNSTGGEELGKFYQKFGVKLNLPDNTVALGTNDISNLELLTVPASVTNGGTFPDRRGINGTPFTTIASIKDKDGKQLYDYTTDNRKRAMDPRVAEVMNQAMRAVVTTGTGKAAGVTGLKVTGKTGTTDESIVIGFQFNFEVDGVWYTGVFRIKSKDNRPLGGLYGGTFVAPLAAEVMNSIVYEMGR